MREYLIIPDFSALKRAAEIAETHHAAFEYNDFFEPAVYSDPDETARRVNAYLALGRDTSRDTLHGVFYDLAPASSDPMIAAYCSDLMERSFCTAEQLGCRGVVFHTGLISGLRLPSYQQHWLSSMERIYRNLCARHPSVELYLENTTEQEPDLIVRMAEQMRDVPNFRLCLDYAHAALTSTPVEVWAKEMGPYVGHIHLNDNDGRNDLHQIPGTGSLDYGRFFELADRYFPNIPILLEVSGAEQSLQALIYFADQPESRQTESRFE